jgi:hypothetical protein
MTASPDSVRDALALVLCSLRDDQEGSGVIKANAADPGEVCDVLADVVAELFRVHARALADGDPLALLDRVRVDLASGGPPA